MSRLEGLEDVLSQSRQRETYEEGHFDYDEERVNQLVNIVKEGTLTAIKSSVNWLKLRFSRKPYRMYLLDGIKKRADFLTEELRLDTEALEPNAFLDAILPALTRYGFLDSQGMHLGEMLLDPLIQALYNVGYNDFIIDTSGSGLSRTDIGNGLTGRRGNPLNMRFIGRVRHFGAYVSDCSLELHGTSFGSDSVATGAYRSDFKFKENISAFGNSARKCTFTFNSLRNYLSQIQQLRWGIDAPNNSKVYVHEVLAEAEIDLLNSAHFFTYNSRHRNQLYVPDDSGGWEEVTP